MAKYRILRVGSTYYPQRKVLWWWSSVFSEPHPYNDYLDRAIGFPSEQEAVKAVMDKFGPEAEMVVKEFEA